MNKRKKVKSHFPHRLAWVLVSPLRRMTTSPSKVIDDAGVKEGMQVLELGCGPGFFTETLAKAVGKEGIIYAHDIQKEMIEFAKKKTANYRKDNIRFICSNSINLPLESQSIDLVFAAHVFEEIEKQKQTELTAKELLRVMKPRAILFIKEHTHGVSLKIMNNIYKQIKHSGFKEIEVHKTLFSYYGRMLPLEGI